MDMAIAPDAVTDPPATHRHRPGPEASRSADDIALKREQISGCLSFVDCGPLAIDAQHGLWLRVRSGLLWVAQGGDGPRRPLREGEHFFAARDGRLLVRAIPRTEIEIDWPPLVAKRLPRGLEAVTLAD